MSFHLRNAEFIADLGPLTQHVGRSVFIARTPKALYHYTTEIAAQQITAKRELWATCITAQEDLTELSHGIALVERLAMELIDHETNPFVKGVLANVSEFMRTRRNLVFITCFCGSGTSPFHHTYGPICLKFSIPAEWRPELRCADIRADTWYSPVIYSEAQQTKAVRAYLMGACRLLKRHSGGNPEQHPIGWMVAGATRDVGQCLLTIVACFKRRKYKQDQEWRLLVMPNLGLSYSAPQMIDDDFARCIIETPKRHVSLRRKRPYNLAEGRIWSPAEVPVELPFDEVVEPRMPSMLSRLKGLLADSRKRKLNRTPSTSKEP